MSYVMTHNADFDVESIQPVGDSVWIGDEFGPYLIEVSVNGRVSETFWLALISTLAS